MVVSASVSGEQYFSDVDSAYSRFAGSYDTMVGMHPSAARAKAAALSRLTRLVPRGGRILDIGCGTGTEAVALARRGYSVVGVDSVEKMVEIARERGVASGLPEERCRFAKLRASELTSENVPGGKFDAAYSFYAVLNLEPRPEQAAGRVASLLPAGAPFIVGLLNPTVLFELSVFPFLGKLKGFRKAASRPVRLKVASGGEDEVDCFLHTPAAFAELCQPWFELKEITGIHFLLPPPREGMLRFPTVLRMVNRMETAVESRYPWNRLGYFSLLTFARTEAGA
ncbi:MAG TPA: class I SAM-dependent methyltransferase [Thermoplasmata archaeon]|nr:class I SAM-dependent methyltransferase [Thermoplasmata archaeon]